MTKKAKKSINQEIFDLQSELIKKNKMIDFNQLRVFLEISENLKQEHPGYSLAMPLDDSPNREHINQLNRSLSPDDNAKTFMSQVMASEMNVD